MAIYKNREVLVGQLTSSSTPTELITITYKDGETENVPLGGVRFTADEKKSLQKTYPSKFDDLEVITDDDIKAVRLGVPPSFDKSSAEAAEAKALNQRAVEHNAKIQEDLKNQADKNLDKKIEKK